MTISPLPDEPFIACGLTDVGRKRSDNQDQFLIAELRKSMLVRGSSLPLHRESRLFGGSRGQLLVVADGMGGHAAGKRASSLALMQLMTRILNEVHWRLQLDQDSDAAFMDSLQELLHHAHSHVLEEASRDESHRGMGTTLTLAHVFAGQLYVVHAGDSRCYLIRDGRAQQLTTDHTLAHQLVQAGGLKPEEEATSRWSNVLWNVLGGHGEHDFFAEVSRTMLQPGDSILLCSDGLSRYVDGHMMVRVIEQAADDVERVCQQLVNLANEAGGDDNITVIVSQPHVSPARAALWQQAASANHHHNEDDLAPTSPASPSALEPHDLDEDTWPG